MNLKNLLSELKRRNVFKAALAYIGTCWVVVQVLSIILPTFQAPEYILKTTIIFLVIGFPFWIIFSWVYEITSDGIKKTLSVSTEESISVQTNNRLNKIIIGTLSIAIVLLVVNMLNYDLKAINEPSEKIETTKEVVDNVKSIAVLAFTDMSPNKDQEYFSDGISEEILNLLSNIPDFKVISRTSSFSFKGKELTVTEIGKKLHVNHILEGSIRKSDNTFRIAVQLIDVSNGNRIWSDTYNQEIKDIFAIQDEIASKVIMQLMGTLLEKPIVSETVNTEAYNLYLQAIQLRNQNTRESIINAEKLTRQSIKIDSTYSKSWQLLGSIINIVYDRYAIRSNINWIKEGKEAANKAISLDSNYTEAYETLAVFNRAEWDFKSARTNIKKALKLSANKSVYGAASLAIDNGNIQDAIELKESSAKLNPINDIQYYSLALDYSWIKKYDIAETYMQKYLLARPNSDIAHSFMAAIFLGMGKNEKALVELEKCKDPFWNLYRKCMVMYALGNKKEANSLLQSFLDEFGENSQPNIAHVYAFRGEIDNAFKWLEISYDIRDQSLLEILNYPEFENLWGDPRWNTFINKLGLPEDHGFHLD
jgi:adenylate cyclase